MKRWQTFGLGLIISGLALYFALRGVNFGDLRVVLAEGNYLWLIPVTLCALASAVVRAVRWRVLLNYRIQLGHSFHITNTAYLFNSLLPMRLGEVVRSFMTTRLDPPIAMTTSLSTVVVERIMDLLSIVVMAIIALALAPGNEQIALAARTSGLLTVVGISVLIFFAVRPSAARQLLMFILKRVPFLKRFPLESLLERVLEGIAPLGSFKTGLPILVLTAVAWLFSALIVYFMLFVFYDSPTLLSALLVTVLTALATALPALPGNVGPFEAGVIFALTLSLPLASAADGQARAFGFAVLFHIYSVVFSVILGWIGLVEEQVSVAGLIQSVRRKQSEG